MWVNIFVSLYWCILLEMTKYHSSLCSFSEKCLDYYGSHFPPTTRAIQWHWFTSRCCYNMLIYVFANTSGPIRAWIRLSFFAHTTEPFSNHLDLFLYVMLVFTIQSVPDGKKHPILWISHFDQKYVSELRQKQLSWWSQLVDTHTPASALAELICSSCFD